MRWHGVAGREVGERSMEPGKKVDVEWAAAILCAWQVFRDQNEDANRLVHTCLGEDQVAKISEATERLGSADVAAVKTVFNTNAARIADFMSDLLTKAAKELFDQAAKRNRGNN